MKSKQWLSLLIGGAFALGMFAGCTTPETPEGPEGPSGPGPQGPDPQTVSEAVRILEGTPYTSDEVTANYGLTDAKSVGVRESEVKERYPARADSEFGAENVVSLDSFEGTDDARMTLALAAAKAANANGDVKLKLPDRDITLTATIVLNGFEGLWIEGGAQTQILIDCASSGWKTAIAVSDCKDLHINSVDLDYTVLPSVTGYVTSSDDAAMRVTMRIPETFRSTVQAYQANSALASLDSVIQFNRFTGGPDEQGIVAIRSENVFDTCTFNGDSEVTLTFKENFRPRWQTPVNNAPVNLAFSMYDASGVTFSSCENVYIEDFDLYACPGMACTVTGSKNFYANRFDLVRKTEERYMTATADGFHVSRTTGDVKLTGCVMENTHDDALNIKTGYWYKTVKEDNNHFTFTVRTEQILMPEEGDVIALYDKDTFELLDTFTVRSVEGDTSSMTVEVNKRISGTVDWSNAYMTDFTRTAKLTFTDNIVRNKRNRGIIVQTRDSVIENNTFQNVGHGSMAIASAMDQYNETTVPDNVRVRNNKFINDGYLLQEGLRGDISLYAIGNTAVVAPAGTITDVEISNNYLSNSGNAGISLRGVGGVDGKEVVVSNNLFYNLARVAVSGLNDCAIELVNCADITIRGNYNYCTNNTTPAILPGGTTDTENIVLENNTNLKYQDFGGEVTNTDVHKVAAGSVTVDGDLSDWASIGNDVVMDGSSETTGDEISHETYQDVFDVRACKIAWTDEGIYIAFEVFDDTIVVKPMSGFWEGDGVEIFLSTITSKPNAEFELYREDGDVMQLFTPPPKSAGYTFTFGESRTNSAIVAGKNRIQVATRIEGDVYSGEIFLPFDLFTDAKGNIDAGEPIAMAFVFMDADRDDIGRKRIQVSNVPHFVETFKTKTARMPVFTFVD